LHVSKRMAIHGLNVSMAVFTGICWFGIQLDRRKAEDRAAEEQRKDDGTAKKGRGKSSGRG